MRGRYEKGIATYEQIMSKAKRMLKESGFKKLRITDICQSLDIKLGTFTYYFQTKTDLVSEIYGELLVKCFNVVRSNSMVPMDMFQIAVTSDYFFYSAILLREETAQYYFEVLENVWHWSYIAKQVSEYYSIYNNDYKLGLTQEEISDFLHIDSAIRHEFFVTMHKEHGLDLNLDLVISHVRKVHTYVYRAMGMDMDMIRVYDDYAESLLRKVGYSSLDLFEGAAED